MAEALSRFPVPTAKPTGRGQPGTVLDAVVLGMKVLDLTAVTILIRSARENGAMLTPHVAFPIPPSRYSTLQSALATITAVLILARVKAEMDLFHNIPSVRNLSLLLRMKVGMVKKCSCHGILGLTASNGHLHPFVTTIHFSDVLNHGAMLTRIVAYLM